MDAYLKKKKFSIQNFEFLFVCQVPLEKLRNFLHSQNEKKLMFFMNEKSFLCNFLIEVGFNVWCVVCIKFQLQSKWMDIRSLINMIYRKLYGLMFVFVLTVDV